MTYLLLFDLDGTLILTGGAGIRAFHKTFRELFGAEVATDGIRFHGRTDLEIIEDICQKGLHRLPTAEELQAICHRYLAHLQDEVTSSPGYRVMPGIPELLRILSRFPDVRLGLGTGNLEGAARIKLARADLNRYFPFGGFGSDAKDRSEVLRKAMERGKALFGRTGEPVQAVVIGDTDLDVACGRAVGAVTVAVATGGTSWETLIAARPDHLLPDLTNPQAFLALLNLSSIA